MGTGRGTLAANGQERALDYLVTDMMQPAFWIAVGQIIWINILLSGDNAVVIALACRSLPPKQRFWGILLGAGAAVVLRIFFTVIIAQRSEEHTSELQSLAYLVCRLLLETK